MNPTLNTSRPFWHNRRSAVTLIELLVATAIAALVLSVTYQAWRSFNGALVWVGTHADAGSSAVLALSRFELELRMSAYSTVTIYSVAAAPATPAILDISFATEDPATLNMSAFVPLTSPAGYLEFIIYYFNAVNQSWNRRVWTDNPAPTPDPAAAGRLTTAQLMAAASGANATDHAVASGVVAAVSTPPSYPVATEVNAIQVNLTIQKADTAGRVVTQTVSAAANPRNQP